MTKLGCAVVILSFFSAYSVADDKVEPCFDFSKKIEKTLVPIPELKAGKDYAQSGELPEGPVYTTVRGIIKRSIEGLVKDISNPYFTRNAEKTDVETKMLSMNSSSETWQVDVKVKVVAFIKIKWSETRNLIYLDGSRQAPKSVLLSYEKTSSDKYPKLKCGSIRLRKVDPKTTDFFLYERVESVHWDLDDMKQYGVGTLRDLRNKRNWQKPAESE